MLDGEWDWADGYLPEEERCGIRHNCGSYNVRLNGFNEYYCSECDEHFSIELNEERYN